MKISLNVRFVFDISLIIINEKFNNDEEFIKDLSMSSNKKHSFILKSEIETFNIKGNRIKANEGCC